MDEKKRLVLLGGGGHCSSVLDAAQRMGMFDEIVITDCDMVAGTEFMGSRVVGTDDALLQLFQDGIRMAFISMGSIKSTKLRKLLYRRAMDMGFYEGVNLSLAYCDDCGHQELEMDVCPKCGSKNLTKIDRMNGYLSYSRVHGDTRLNDAKMAEIAERKSM